MDAPDEPRSRDRADDGATAVEYALMVTLIAVAIVAAVVALGLGVDGLFQTMCGGASPFTC